MVIIFLIVGWIVFCYIAAEVIPALLVLIYYAFAFFFMCVFESMKFMLIGAGWAVRWGTRILTRTIVRLAKGVYWVSREAGLFLYILLDEWRRGANTDESADAEPDEEDEAQHAYEAARTLFGLKPAFSRAALDRAYKQAMKRAHPDAGGSTEEAQVINAARDFLMQAEGWK